MVVVAFNILHLTPLNTNTLQHLHPCCTDLGLLTGHAHPDGLHVQSRRIPGVDLGRLEARLSFSPKYCAFPGIINGGVLSTAMDCHGKGAIGASVRTVRAAPGGESGYTVRAAPGGMSSHGEGCSYGEFCWMKALVVVVALIVDSKRRTEI